MHSIKAILIVVTLAGIALWVTRRRPFWGVLLVIGFAALVALYVTLFSHSRSHSSHIHIVEHTSGHGPEWEVMTAEDSELVTSSTEITKVFVDRDVAATVRAESPSEHGLASHNEDEPCEDCDDEVVAEVEDESDFEQQSELLAANDSEGGDSEGGDSAERAERQFVRLSADKPAWIYQLTPELGNTKHLVVQSGPYETLEECDSRLAWAMKDAVRDYINEYFENRGRSVPNWFRLQIPDKDLEDAITQRFVGLHDFEVAGADPMPVKYVELTLDQGFHRRVIDRHYEQAIQMTRIAQSGVGSIGVLGLIVTALGVLKFENQTPTRRRGVLAVAIGTSLALLLGFALIVAAIR